MKKIYLFCVAVILLLLNPGIKAQCLDQSVSPVSGSLTCAGSGTISLASSEAGVNYYVRNDATSVTVSGPVAGTGSTLLLGTGHMTTSTIYNIRAAKATGGLAFDGIDDYVAIANPVNSNADFSWEVWIKTNADGTIFSKSDATGNWVSGAKSLYIQNGKITFEVFGAGSVNTYNVYNDNNWHHVVVTAEMGYLGGVNDRIRLYVDGAFLSEKNNWDIQVNSETGLINKIGYTNPNFPVTPYFNGIMDDFKIWSAVRTATDITVDMTSCLTGTETGLDAYYTFENGTGTTLSDIAGADNTGTLTNMPGTDWVFGRDDCGSCSFQLTQKPVYVVTPISDQTLTAQTLTLCSTASTNINAAGSETGVNYYLRDNSTYAVISGPDAGTGGTLGLSTGFVVTTTTYNVLANKISGALNFDGVDDYVIANENSVIENLGLAPFTMEAWVFPNSTSGVRSIIRKDGDYNLYLNNGNVVAEAFPSGGNGGALYQAASTATVAANKWTHVAAVWNGTNFNVYINGITTTVSASTLSSTLTSKFCIGGSKAYSGQVFDGRIDEVRLWSSVRTVSQLTASLGSCLTGTESTLIGYYQFEDGKGSSVLTDKTSNGNNGILSNMDDVQAWRGGTDNCGCSMMLSQLPVITVNTTPTVSVNSGSVCSGKSFTILPLGASAYTITGGSLTVTPASTTSYSVTGTNTSGCVSMPAVATITVNASPTVAATSYSICSGTSLVIVPTGADSYSITGNTFTVSPSVTTSYSITGTSTLGCIGTNTMVSTVTVNTTPTISVNSASVCSGSSFAIVPSGANTYTVSGGSFTVTPAVGTTTYSVAGTATNGCLSASMAIASVTVNITPTVIVNSATVCSGNSVAIVPTGAGTYSITGNTFTVTPASTTSYSVTGTSTAGCTSGNAVSTISVNSTPTISINSGSVCSGGTFTLQPSGAGAYTITGNAFTVTPSATTSYSLTGSNGACMAANTVVATVTVNTTPTISVNSLSICSGNSVAIVPSGASTYTITSNTFTVSPLITTSYSITGTGTNACVPGQAIATVSVNTTPTVSVNSGAICAGSSFVLVPSGAGAYTVTGNNFTVSPAGSTSYSVSGTSTAGCISNAAIATVTVNAIPFITVSNGAICPGNAFTLMPQGASSYTYSGGSGVVTPGTTTSYTITGSSAQGCMASNTAVATVSVVNNLSVSVNGNTQLCSGQSTTLTATGAATYTWNTSVMTTTISLSPNATTSYTVTGASGTCSNSTVVTISVSPIPTISVNNGSLCAGGVFTIIPSGAASYTISGGSATVSPAASASYSVTGSSGPGCVSTNTAISSVVIVPLPVVTAASSNSIICFGESAILAAFGGTSYVWSDAQTGGSVTIAPPVTEVYTVTGTSAAGCVNTGTVLQRVDNCTGISKNNSGVAFSVYPNPNNGRFVVESAENTSITILNTLGEAVYHGVTNGTTSEISISQLANGVYFIKASDHNKQHVVRLVKE